MARYFRLEDDSGIILLEDEPGGGLLLENQTEGGRPLVDRSLADASILLDGMLTSMPVHKLAPLAGTVRFLFTTNNAAGAALDPSNAFEAADIRIYKDGGTSQFNTDVTINSTFDGVTGLHQVVIVLTDSVYSLGSHFDVVLLPDETIEGQSVVAMIGSFQVVLPGSSGLPLFESTPIADSITASVLAQSAVDEIAAGVAAAIPPVIPPASQRNLERTGEGLSRGVQRAAAHRNLERDGEGQPR